MSIARIVIGQLTIKFMKIKVKSYIRQSPSQVYRMGKKAEKFSYDYKPRKAGWDKFMDRFEWIFKRLVLAGVLAFLGIMTYSITVEKLAHAMSVPNILEIPFESKRIPEILIRICKAESGLNHTLNGKVVTNKNKDGTIDAGICQINSIHWEDAKKLGYDIMKEQDNWQYARHLFFTQGSVPWRASAYGKNGWINN